MALAGAAILVALLAAYLGDCIPGLGAGRSLGPAPPEAPTPAPDADPEPDAKATGDSRVTITVTGERCAVDSGEPQPCPVACAGLPAPRPAQGKVVVEIDAVLGTHGAVEALRTCLVDAGFTDVRVRSE